VCVFASPLFDFITEVVGRILAPWRVLTTTRGFPLNARPNQRIGAASKSNKAELVIIIGPDKERKKIRRGSTYRNSAISKKNTRKKQGGVETIFLACGSSIDNPRCKFK
jgi:hypothetical protein